MEEEEEEQEEEVEVVIGVVEVMEEAEEAEITTIMKQQISGNGIREDEEEETICMDVTKVV